MFECELRTYTGDDPLEIWHSYINWTEQNFPRGGKDGKLLALLENVIEKFKDQPMYKNDKRYIDAWLKLITLHSDPLAMFQVMWDLGHGSTVAAFYQAWSWSIEQLGNLKKADTIYQLGLQHKAEPFEWLKRQHSEFQARVARRSAGEFVDPNEGDPIRIQEPKRVQLSHLKTHGKNKIVSNNRVGSAFHTNHSGLGNMSAVQTSNIPARGIQVFCDENATSSIPTPSGEWQNIPQRAKFNAENEQKAGIWTNKKVKQKTVSNIPVSKVSDVSKLAFSVHEDVDQPPATPTHSQPLFCTNNVLSDCKPSKSLDIFQRLQKLVVEPPGIQVAYRKDLVYKGTVEMQFEEIRGARYRAYKKEKEQEILIKELEEKNQILLAEQVRIRAEQDQMRHQMLLEQKFFRDMQQRQEALEAQLKEKLVLVDNTAAEPLCDRKPQYDIYHDVPDKNFNDRKIGIDTEQMDVSCSPHLSHAQKIRKVPDPATISEITKSIQNLSARNVDNTSVNSFHNKSTPHESTSSLLKTPNLSKASGTFGHTPDSRKSNLKKGSHTPKGSIIMPSPTMNTKAAMQAVLGMFNDTLDVEAHFGLTNNKNTDLEPMDTNFEPMHALHSHLEHDAFQPPSHGIVVFEDKPPNKGLNEPNDVKGQSQHYNKCPDPENQENRAPLGYQQESRRRGLNGVLQPSFGFATSEYVMGSHGKRLQDIDNDDDLEGIVPLPDDADLTFAPSVASTARFNIPTHMISTPFHPYVDMVLPDAGVSKIHQHSNGTLEDNTMMEQERHSNNIIDKENESPAYIPAMRTRCSVGVALLSPISEASEKSSSSNEASTNRLGLTTAHHSTISNHLNNTKLSSLLHTDPRNKSSHAANDSRNLKFGNNCAIFAKPVIENLDNLNQTCHEVDLTTYEPPVENDRMKKIMQESVMINSDNPFDPNLIASFIANLHGEIQVYSNYVKCEGMMPMVVVRDDVGLGADTYFVKKKIGEGSYGTAYAAEPFEDLSNKCKEEVCLKLQKPACQWELYIAHELQQRLASQSLATNVQQSFSAVKRGYFYNNGSCLVTRYHEYGTILNLVNSCQTSRKLPEFLSVYLTIELLLIAESLIACNIIHGDFKPDNLLLMQLPIFDCGKATIGEYMSQRTRCLQLIDFGRSIDMTLFPTGTTFTASVDVADLKCIEMKTGMPWTWQTDLFGIAGIVHTLLFGTYMKVYQGPNNRWKTNSKCKRWHNETLWNHLFDELLNVPSCDELPDLKSLRKMFEEYFMTFKCSNDDMVNVHTKLTHFLSSRK